MRRALRYASSIGPAKVCVTIAGVREDVTIRTVRPTASIQVTPRVMRASATFSVRRRCYIRRARRYLVIKTARTEAVKAPASWRLVNTALTEVHVITTPLAVTYRATTIVVDARLLTHAIPDRVCVSR